MNKKHIINLVKVITESYKFRFEKLYSYSETVQIYNGPKISKLGIYLFEFFFSLYVFFHTFFYKRNKKKYIFINSKYSDIICSLDRRDVLVMGGITDFFFCFGKGIKFVWIGYLVKAFNIHYYYGRSDAYVKSLSLLNKAIPDGNCKKHLLLWEDDLTVGLSFSHLFNKNKLVNVICIQHGLFVSGELIKPVGSNSNYNFLIKKSQAKFFENYNDNCCEIGITYDVSTNPKFKKNIYLIGIGGLGINDPIYLYSIYLYSVIIGKFTKSKSEYRIFYRPHPIEDIDFCRKLFKNIDTTPVKDLFGLSKSTYIGFQSTLLYEAKYFGNVTIAIESEKMSQHVKDFSTDLIINENDLEHIVDKLNSFIENDNIFTLFKTKEIKKRFGDCMSKVYECDGL